MLIQYGIRPILRNSKQREYYRYLIDLNFDFSLARLSLKRRCIILTYNVQHNILRTLSSA
jgi:hypothetical protein